MVVRKTKTDRRDARHLRDLLQHDRFPTVWVPDPVTRDQRALLTHRLRLVRMRTMIKNGLHAIALNRRLSLGRSLLTQRGLVQLRALALPPHTAHRRDESLELLAWLNTRIDALDEFVAHYHGERNHQGLGNRLITPETRALQGTRVQCRERLGGLLRYYHRAA
jgi:transposase